MIKALLLFFCICINVASYAESGQAYLDKFKAYSQWNQYLPTSPDSIFLAFVDGTSPLSRKLREKWLYQLAWNKDWITFSQHYQDSPDISLQCYAQFALYQQGKQKQAIEMAEKLWLSGNSLPKPCDGLFSLLLKNNEINEKVMTQRIVLALENRNVHLTSYLLKQFKPARIEDAKLIADIQQNPRHISTLQPGKLHGEFYLYGLKKLVSINMDLALSFWQHPKTNQLLNDAQKQSFFAYVSLYKAMRNQADTTQWFAKVKPAFYNDVLLGWQIRYALKYKQWRQVERLIQGLQDKDNPCWQYWLARSMAAQGQTEQAVAIYQRLAKLRHYYGFLASLRLKQDFNFENEQPNTDMQTLQPYQPFTAEIKALFTSKQTLTASRLVNDFMSELPKDEKSALAYWLSHDLQWHGKTVYLASNNELNNQLALRFPLAYRESVVTYAKNYQIPKALVYAIIRQESGFRDDVISPAGAHGLMQVMPTTAKVVSKFEHIAYSDNKQLFLSQKNINIGVAYLQQLAKRFGQHPILMSAAYNAGPKQVVYWMKNHPPKEMDIWIETLPWQETRNYLKNIIAFYVIYQYRMQEKPDLSAFMKPFWGNNPT